MGIGALEFTRLRHTQGNLGYGRTAIGQKSIRSKPGRCSTFLLVLAHTHIDGIMVLGNIPVDIIEAPVAHMHIDFAPEYSLQEGYESR